MSLTGLLFVLAFLAGCVMALARHPVYGAITYIATFFLSPPLRWWGQGVLLPIRWALIAAAVTIIALWLQKRRAKDATPARMRHPILPLFLALIAWLLIESLWSLDETAQREFVEYYVKFMLAVWFVHRCADGESSIRLIMWTYVLGCFYFGWIAYSSYEGGRFEDFGGAGISEANAGALTLVIGVFLGSALFIESSLRRRGMLLVVLPFIVNGIVTTISRSGFVAAAVGGLIFNWFTPAKFSSRVRLLSVLAIMLFLILAGPAYWTRMESLTVAGEEVAGVDTGSGRLVLLRAQWEMFKDHPLGCGAACTVVLSPNYLDARHLDRGGRASHNTFMTMLVEHGIPGALFYVMVLIWSLGALRQLKRHYRSSNGFMATALPAFAATIVAITVGDMFVPYAKFEVRFWFIALLMAMLDITLREQGMQEPAVAVRRRTARKAVGLGIEP